MLKALRLFLTEMHVVVETQKALNIWSKENGFLNSQIMKCLLLLALLWKQYFFTVLEHLSAIT